MKFFALLLGLLWVAPAIALDGARWLSDESIPKKPKGSSLEQWRGWSLEEGMNQAGLPEITKVQFIYPDAIVAPNDQDKNWKEKDFGQKSKEEKWKIKLYFNGGELTSSSELGEHEVGISKGQWLVDSKNTWRTKHLNNYKLPILKSNQCILTCQKDGEEENFWTSFSIPTVLQKNGAFSLTIYTACDSLGFRVGPYRL